MKMKKVLWILKMAWRESRHQKKRLFLFTSAVIIGIGALVAINSFRINLDATVDNKAKSLLSADLVLRSNHPFNEKIYQKLDSLKAESSREISFSSMIYFVKNGKTRLVNVRALEGGFPFYGDIGTRPADAYQTYRNSRNALLDDALMIQFDAANGDSVRIGQLTFKIDGALIKIPGQAAVVSSIAPNVFIPLKYVEDTGLIRFGSLIQYRTYLKLAKNFDVKTYVEKNKNFFRQNDVRLRTVQDRKENLGRINDNLTTFFNLIGIFSLILGTIGVFSSITIYIRQKMPSIAVLRCLGATGTQVLQIYTVQTMIFGFIGSLVGVLLGIGIQFSLPSVAATILPLDVSLFIAWTAVLEGFSGGLLITSIFILLPLLRIRYITPLLTLRSSVEEDTMRLTGKISIIITGFLGLFILSLLVLEHNHFIKSLIFVIAIITAIGLFALVSRGIMKLSRKIMRPSWPYILRQGLANLYRPNNQTAVLLMALGMGVFLISTLYFMQHILLNQVSLSGSGENPNMVLFDIQSDQLSSVEQTIKEMGLPIKEEVPIVTMRLASINDVSVDVLKNDTTGTYEHWALNHELRSTYRDHLTDSEKIIEGRFDHQNKDSVFISVADGYRDALNLKLGDKVVFDVQGVPLTTWVGSIRQVNFNRMEPNFLVVFPPLALKDAPQFHILVTRINGPEQSARLQRRIVQNFPGISIIDLELILNTLQTVLDEITFVIRFMAFFTIFTGLIVMITSLSISKYQRIRETVLLRTIGAEEKVIRRIFSLEYFILGMLSALTGIILSFLFSWALSYFVFDTVFLIPGTGILLIFLLIPALTLGLGAIGNRRLYNYPPLEVLRAEV